MRLCVSRGEGLGHRLVGCVVACVPSQAARDELSLKLRFAFCQRDNANLACLRDSLPL